MAGVGFPLGPASSRSGRERTLYRRIKRIKIRPAALRSSTKLT